MAALLDKIFKKKEKKTALPADQSKPPKEKEGKKPAGKKKKEIVKKITVKDKKRLAKVYAILKEPHITEKATALAEKGQYVFKVVLKTNKIEVKKAVESLYSVKVAKVRIIKIAGKKRRLGKAEGWKQGLKKGYKKAIVTLAQGEKIEVMPR